MKVILLASSGTFVTEKASEFLPKPLSEMKIAYITTASKGVSDKSYMENRNKRMNELKYNYEEIDIDGKTQEELKNILDNKDVIYVEGGNTFYLLKSVRESGFDKVVKELIEKGVIYIGSSAGSYIVCPTIEMAAWKHQDLYNHYGITDLTGLNLVPFLVSVHYKPEHKQLLQEKVSGSKYPVKILTDDQALLIIDDVVKLVGDGEEVNIG